jgi:hypothetical protein
LVSGSASEVRIWIAIRDRYGGAQCQAQRRDRERDARDTKADAGSLPACLKAYEASAEIRADLARLSFIQRLTTALDTCPATPIFVPHPIGEAGTITAIARAIVIIATSISAPIIWIAVITTIAAIIAPIATVVITIVAVVRRYCGADREAKDACSDCQPSVTTTMSIVTAIITTAISLRFCRNSCAKGTGAERSSKDHLLQVKHYTSPNACSQREAESHG